MTCRLHFQETAADIQSVYVTIAADLVISQIAEPVRFVIETKARIYPSTEKYWYYAKKTLAKQYQVLRLLVMNLNLQLLTSILTLAETQEVGESGHGLPREGL